MIIKFNLYFTMMPLWPFVSLALSDIRAIYSWLISSVLPRMHVNTFSRSQSQKILFGINKHGHRHKQYIWKAYNAWSKHENTFSCFILVGKQFVYVM